MGQGLCGLVRVKGLLLEVRQNVPIVLFIFALMSRLSLGFVTV